MRLLLATLAPLLGLFLWRSKYTLYYNMLTRMDLPDGYYSEGEVSSHCRSMNSASDQSFKYCEDASFWENYDADGKLEERRVVVSCDSGRREWNTVMGPLLNPLPRGSLWIHSPKSGQTTRLTLENFPEEHTFHPLGVEVYPSYSGNASYMYVVNHAANKTVIEQFLISPLSSSAKHIRTLSHPFFIASNAIALTSPTSFYVTNDHIFTKRLPYVGAVLPMVETILGLPLSFTAHVTINPDEKAKNVVLSHTIVAPFVAYSNGISISPSGLEVAIASTSIGTIYFYSRNATTNALTFSTSVQLPFPPDNVKYDHDGNLVTGGHPHFPSLLQLLARKVDVAPSWVVSISPIEGVVAPEYDAKATLSASTIIPPPTNHTVQTLFQSNGKTFSTSTSGLLDTLSGNLYITGLYAEDGAMICHP
ncbi:hypothetical protein DFJ43DRAFT_153531 [Lentinula guzmanii]|uniref:Calcium-dependent phosphotriesterase n=1 Tax=Lentinula guzmanii TaxID=2804957 RepID=A0AA38JQN9_9AGAR|nr:hypothetical protein DFJ43DRAFT_153531 [Lentinula guzmanii]